MTASTAVDLDVLAEIQRRVLWLAVRMVDAANHGRSTGDGVKVGGHQASSASLVTAMTALWFAHLNAERPGRASSRTPRRCSTPSSTCSATWTAAT